MSVYPKQKRTGVSDSQELVQALFKINGCFVFRVGLLENELLYSGVDSFLEEASRTLRTCLLSILGDDITTTFSLFSTTHVLAY